MGITEITPAVDPFHIVLFRISQLDKFKLLMCGYYFFLGKSNK